MNPSVRVGDIAAALEERFPQAWAEPWDRVGLRIGDPQAPVASVYVALDASLAALRSAAAHGCQALVTHHPPFLGELPAVVSGSGPGSLVIEACALGVAVISAHTNLDRSPEGSRALAETCGFRDTRPLEASLEDAELVTVYAPEPATAAIVDAMAAAGAGRLGLYERCSFVASGIGAFTPMPGATPTEGLGEPASVPEARIEMVAPRGAGHVAAAAARRVHPYEEPLITVTPIRRQRAMTTFGAVADIGTTALSTLASSISERLGHPARVWGPAERSVSRVAFANGSAGSLIDHALAAGADAFVVGEVRYHDARRAFEAGLAIVEVGHDVSELPLVGVLARALRSVVGETAVIVDEAGAPGWWVSVT